MATIMKGCGKGALQTGASQRAKKRTGRKPTQLTEEMTKGRRPLVMVTVFGGKGGRLFNISYLQARDPDCGKIKEGSLGGRKLSTRRHQKKTRRKREERTAGGEGGKINNLL